MGQSTTFLGIVSFTEWDTCEGREMRECFLLEKARMTGHLRSLFVRHRLRVGQTHQKPDRAQDVGTNERCGSPQAKKSTLELVPSLCACFHKRTARTDRSFDQLVITQLKMQVVDRLETPPITAIDVLSLRKRQRTRQDLPITPNQSHHSALSDSLASVQKKTPRQVRTPPLAIARQRVQPNKCIHSSRPI